MLMHDDVLGSVMIVIKRDGYEQGSNEKLGE